jgi:apolipoprotein N-acyltransferase
VVIEPRAWGALLYLLFTLATGIIYFTWTVTGISVSLGLLILIIGIPIAGLFILSTRGLALLEGRMVEALLGIRMPHRPLFSPNDKGIWAKFKALTDLTNTPGFPWSTCCYSCRWGFSILRYLLL